MVDDDRAAMRVAVLAGGDSDEREISLMSGKHVLESLRQAGFARVELVDPADSRFIQRMGGGEFDVAFVALHGKGGEDGGIQSILDLLGVPYTGSDPCASAFAMDKDVAKLLYARAGIPVAPSVALHKGDKIEIDEILSVVGHSSFVKPTSNGSSYGVVHVTDPSKLEEAIGYAFGFGEKIMIESGIEGTEISVGVIGEGKTLRALPIVEIRMPEKADFYDSTVKYVDPSEIHRIPARIAERDYVEAQRMACLAHRTLGCSGFSRSDFIVTEDGPVILETNTIPGLTEMSLFPDELRHAGVPFAEACAEIIEIALRRAGR